MHNSDAEALIIECDRQMQVLDLKIHELSATDEAQSFYTNFAVIQCCGTIEQSIKIIIFDKLSNASSNQISTYLDKIIKNGSMNPSLENIKGLIGQFDRGWKQSITDKINVLPNKVTVIDELKSLNKLRNDFAHGKNISSSFSNVKNYYISAKIITDIVDEVLQV